MLRQENNKLSVNISNRHILNPLNSPRSGKITKPSFVSNLQRAVSLNHVSLPKIVYKADSQTLSFKQSPQLSPLLQSKSSSLSSTTLKSTKTYGKVKAYCANTNKGLIREINEDRVMIASKILKPNNRKSEKWPLCSYFAVYDGHGGKECCNFLRDNLHNFICQDSFFPKDPSQAILRVFLKAEQEYLEFAIKNKKKSGSCAIVLILVGKTGYLTNLGDSRGILSEYQGNKITQLSSDHKPTDEYESQRIKKAGGEVYNTSNKENNSVSRVFPGRLSVTRTIGDIDAKIPEFGGNPNVVLAVPEIKIFRIHSNTDFVVLASDGIFDALENKEVAELVFKFANSEENTENKLAKGVENVIIQAMNKNSSDNLTVLAVAFEGFENAFEKVETIAEISTNNR